MANFFAHGKLLLTAEYLVVKGAKSLAIPTRVGQHLELKEGSGSELVWKSLDHKGNEWFSAKYDLMGFDCLKTTDEDKAAYLRKVLRAVCRDNSDFLSKWKKYRVTTKLDYPQEWGLGSSSTLIHLLCQWAEANPYLVYFDLFNGSGYDIACADADGPLFYQFLGDSLHVETAEWKPSFLDQLYVVYTGQKQDSVSSVRDFLKKKVKKADIKKADELTQSFYEADDLVSLEAVIEDHENHLSSILGQPTIQSTRFSDYWGKVKSMGAWGGDMALATSDQGMAKTKEYFKSKGCDTVMLLGELGMV